MGPPDLSVNLADLRFPGQPHFYCEAFFPFFFLLESDVLAESAGIIQPR